MEPIMNLKIQALFLLLLLLVTVSSSFASRPRKIPRLGVTLRSKNIGKNNYKKDGDFSSIGFKTFYYKQTIDHFNYNPESYTTFKHRYIVNTNSWTPGKLAPIFAYLGEEAPIDNDVSPLGFIPDNAQKFGALLVYIEHRFYGKSIPFGISQEKALKNATVRGYFNSAQALADYAEVLLHVKKQYKAENSPIIVFGGSYGGMLATWFRLKYPHIALGALASSAPILYFDKITPSDGYYKRVTQDFKEASKNCYKTIKKSWSEIDRVAAQPNGLATLSKKFKTCQPLTDASQIKVYLDDMYASAAQYDSPPLYPVTTVCGGIDSGKHGKDILGRIFSGVAAYRGEKSCYDLSPIFSEETLDGWAWQTCSDMVMPIGRGSHDTMFPASPFILKAFEDDCKSTYGVLPRPHWITTYFGGQRIREVLKRFGSNIIFSNGLRDPYSTAGVTEDISDTLIAVTTKNGSHCLDLRIPRDTDPEWLILMRNIEVEIINSWLLKYNQDMLQSVD